MLSRKRSMRMFIFFVCCLTAQLMMPATGIGQNQLVVMRGERVLFRFREGDMLKVKTADGVIRRSFIAEVNDTSVITGRDTMLIQNIRKVYASRTSFINVVGGAMIAGGTLYFLIDQFNTSVVHGEDIDIDPSVAKASATLVTTGAVLFFVRKRSHALHGRVKLRSVDSKSIFFEHDYRPVKGYVSPYIPRN